MATPTPHPAISADISFERYVIRPSQRDVLVDGTSVRLGGRAFDVLITLVERRDRVVSKHELLDLVWPGMIVEENNLQVHISTLRKLLGPQVIATIPGRGYRFTAVLDTTTVAPVDPIATPPAPPTQALTSTGNLPHTLPALFGREEDVAALVALVRAHRLVTVIGAGGIGKTRLAQAVALAETMRWPDGVWLIELASINEPELLGVTVAHALGIVLTARKSAVTEVAEALSTKRLLLVLDNCEHLLASSAAMASALLAQASGVCVLATSQEPLHLIEEQQFRLQPLTIPEDATSAAACEYGAVALFAARARSADPRFELTDKNLGSAIDICRRLDGIALAIELAAARVLLLGVDGVRARLDDRFRVLTGGARIALKRHQTLRAAVEWSYALLTDDERTVLCRLGVFVGSFGLASAQHVAADGEIDVWAALEHLGALLDKSLVSAVTSEEPRYRLLETTRSFALEKLQEHGDTDIVFRRHAEAMRTTFEQSLSERWNTLVQTRLARYMSDIDNLRAALGWADGRAEASELLIALVGASTWLWLSGGQKAEGLRYCGLALERVDDSTAPALEARLQMGYSSLDDANATAQHLRASERAVSLYRLAGDRAGLYAALVDRARAVALSGDLALCQTICREAENLVDPAWPPALRAHLLNAKLYFSWAGGQLEEARALAHTSYQLAMATGDTGAILNSLIYREQIAATMGHLDEAVVLGREIVDRGRGRQQRFSVSIPLGNLSAALTELGQLDEALAVARECVPIKIRDGSLWIRLDAFALLAFKRGRIREAALTLGCVEATYTKRGHPRQPNEQRARDQVMVALQQKLPKSVLKQLLLEGASLSDQEAAQIALAD